MFCKTCSKDNELCLDCESGYFLKNQQTIDLEYLNCIACDQPSEVAAPRELDQKLICFDCNGYYVNCKTCKSSNCETCSDGYFLTDPRPSFSKNQCGLCNTNSEFKFENTEGITVCRSCSSIDINCLTCMKGNCQSCKKDYFLFDSTNDLLIEACVLCNDDQTFKGRKLNTNSFDLNIDFIFVTDLSRNNNGHFLYFLS